MTNNNYLNFTKMQGAGNDFVLFDNRTLGFSDMQIQELAPRLSDRKFGIGSDGIIALQYDETKEADLVMVYKNPDGSDAGMCGNGARCFAKYAESLGCPPSFTFKVHDNIYRAEVNGTISTIYFPLETEVKPVKIGKEEYLDIYTNTEHIVCSASLELLTDEAKLRKKGSELRYHKKFEPKGTNVNFIRGVAADSLELQTYERGVEDLTLACGTGAIASAIAWHHLQDKAGGKYNFEVNVKGGTLTVGFTFDSSNKHYTDIKLEGPATFVFEGQYAL